MRVQFSLPPPLVYYTVPDSSRLTYRTKTVLTERTDNLCVPHRADLLLSPFGPGLANALANQSLVRSQGLGSTVVQYSDELSECYLRPHVVVQ